MTATTTVYDSRLRDGLFCSEIGHGKTRAFVAQSRWGVTVCTLNASHRAWKGPGRSFTNLAAALAAYKSPAMQAILQRAGEECTRQTLQSIAREAV